MGRHVRSPKDRELEALEFRVINVVYGLRIVRRDRQSLWSLEKRSDVGLVCTQLRLAALTEERLAEPLLLKRHALPAGRPKIEETVMLVIKSFVDELRQDV